MLSINTWISSYGIAVNFSCKAVLHTLRKFTGGVKFGSIFLACLRCVQSSLSLSCKLVVQSVQFQLSLRIWASIVPSVDTYYLAWIKSQRLHLACKTRQNLEHPLYIVIVTKKPPMCRIICLSLYCMNGSIESRCINYKNPSVCNTNFIARSVLLEFFKVMRLPSIDLFMQ